MLAQDGAERGLEAPRRALPCSGAKVATAGRVEAQRRVRATMLTAGLGIWAAITIAVAGPVTSPEYLPVHVAQAEGYFAQEKLDVTLKVELFLGEVALGLGDMHRQVFGRCHGARHRDGDRRPDSESRRQHGRSNPPLSFYTPRCGHFGPRAWQCLPWRLEAVLSQHGARAAVPPFRASRTGDLQDEPREPLGGVGEGQAAGSSSLWGRTTAPPASATSRALAVCSSPLVPGSGTKSAGTPS